MKKFFSLCRVVLFFYFCSQSLAQEKIVINEHTLEGFSSCVVSVRLDGKFLAVGDETGKLAVLWKDKNYQPVWETKHEHGIRSIVWARRGESIAVCFSSGYGASWPMGTFLMEAEQTDKAPSRQLKSGFVRVRKTREELVTSACWSFTGAFFAVGAREQEIGLSRRVQEAGQIPKNEPYANILPGGEVSDLDWSPDERNLLAVGLRSGAVRIWDANLPEGLLLNVPATNSGAGITVTRLTNKQHRGARKFKASEQVENIAWLSDGNSLAIQTTNSLFFWEPETGEEIKVEGKFHSLSANPAFSEVAVISSEDVIVYGANQKKKVVQIAKLKMPQKGSSLSWTIDGKTLIIGGTGKIYLVQIRN